MAELFKNISFDPDLGKNDFEFEDITPMDDEAGETIEQTETISDLPEVPEIGADIKSIETQEAVDKLYELITDQGWEDDRNAPVEYKAVF